MPPVPASMNALVFTGTGLAMEERPIPLPGPGEARIRVTMAGICNTDVELYQGYYGFSGVAGHEFTGVVDRAPDQPELEGLGVTAEINCGCGACLDCLAGDPRHCPTRTVIGIVARQGAFAQYLVVPITNLHLLPKGVDDTQAVFTEPLAAALEIAEQVHLTPRTKTLVLGDGKLGLLIACALRVFCPSLVCVGKHPEKLAVAQAHGVKTIHVSGPDQYARHIGEFGRFDVVVEATGSENGPALALDWVKPRGTLVAKTTSRNPSLIDMARVVVDEIRIQGSRCGDFSWALSFLEQGLVEVTRLVEEIYSFDRFEEAMARAMTPGAKKVLVKF